ncbi:MAG: DUF3883 domain-containing protein, partial [Myxococcales bacterium]|nr:DUF3883 domain-containing protein [Myxococcales bacterium]
GRRLAPAGRVLVADAPWFVDRLRGAAVALVHPRVSEEVVAALDLRRLSQAAHEEVAEAPALSGSPDKQAFCRELSATIHHPAFTAGLRRLLAAAGHSDPAAELELLSELRIEATDRLLTHLRIAGVDQPLGAEEVAIFADDRAKVIYIGGDHWDTVVVQISEAINRLLGGGLDNLSHLEAILRTRPPEILDLLDHRRVPRLHGEDEAALRADADAVADDEALDFASAAESLFDEDPEPPPAPPKGRAIGLERVAFVATEEPAAGDRNPVSIAAIAAAIAAERDADRKAVEMPAGTPGYDVQSGRISDPQARFIRVYGLDGPWDQLPVVLSSRDASAARTFGRQYWLYVVEHARDPGRARVHKLQDPLSRIARYALDHRWREQAERDGGGAQTPQVGWIHHPPTGEAAAIVGVEKVGMFTWVRVRLANGKEERRFFKPAIDRVEPS